MQGLYEKYVRFGYYEQEHRVRSALVGGIAMAALLWRALSRMDGSSQGSETHYLLYALEYSAFFAVFRVLFSRSRRQQERFARWAARHPVPEPNGRGFVPGTGAEWPGVPRGRDRLAWFGWTLLVAFGVYWCVGFTLAALIGLDSQHGAVAAVIAAVMALPLAMYLRFNWPPIRNWKATA
jgi:hypothetical protein